MKTATRVDLQTCDYSLLKPHKQKSRLLRFSVKKLIAFKDKRYIILKQAFPSNQEETTKGLQLSFLRCKPLRFFV